MITQEELERFKRRKQRIKSRIESCREFLNSVEKSKDAVKIKESENLGRNR